MNGTVNKVEGNYEQVEIRVIVSIKLRHSKKNKNCTTHLFVSVVLKRFYIKTPLKMDEMHSKIF